MSLDKKLELVRFKHSPNYNILMQAMEVVREYIMKNKLIIYGGMSQDLALRSVGSYLYPDDAIPDYDMLSTNHSKDAYTIGQLICLKGIKDVDVITAMHMTTMRVRVHGYYVADVSFYPQSLFKKLRTIEYKGFTVLHPWYSVYDQFSALSMPFENPPTEVIFSRWKKDIERMTMLLKYFPINVDTDAQYKRHLVKKPSGEHMITGWSALAWYNKEAKLEDKYPTRWSDSELELPVGYNTYISENINDFITKETRYFNSVPGYLRHIELPDAHVYYSRGCKITCINGTISSIHALMTYAMYRWLTFDDPLDRLLIKNAYEIYRSGKWGLTIDTYGTHLWSPLMIEQLLRMQDPSRWKLVPSKQTFADDCDITKNFKHSDSELFRIDGSATSKFTDAFDPEEFRIRYPERT